MFDRRFGKAGQWEAGFSPTGHHVVRTAGYALAALIALAVFTASAAARAPAIRVQPTRVHAGDRVLVYGNAGSCPRGDRVTLISRAFSHRHDFAGRPAIFTRVRRRGRFSVSTRIPRSRRPRRYAITGRCGGGSLGVTAHLRVLRPRSSRVRSSYCSPSGDFCTSVTKSGGDVLLRIGTFAFSGRYTLCVIPPRGPRVCKRFRLRAGRFGIHKSTVSWRRQYPNQGRGLYRVRWRKSGANLGPRLGFRR
jgi:hypothetical protein